jgi:hypothetical protein
MATMTFGLSGSIVNSNKTYSGSDTDMIGLMEWTSVTYRNQVLAQPPSVSFSGSISGTTLTVTAVASGNLATNQFIFVPGGGRGTAVTDGTYITALGTGGGGPGTYTVNMAQTVIAQALTAYGPDLVSYGLFRGTLDFWIGQQQSWVFKNNMNSVAPPPPMGWS